MRSSSTPRSGGGTGRERGQAESDEWWSTYFDADYLREYGPVFSPERDRREVARLVEVLGLPVGARILDCPCGQGRHAHLLAEAGFTVDGLDYSRDLLSRARARGTSKSLRYTRGDMRDLPARWTGRFDAVINLFTSFGFFADPAADAQVAAEFARVLQRGGTLVWHGGSRDGIMARFLSRDWWETAEGVTVGHERSFDPLSGILTIDTAIRTGASIVRRAHRIRLYTATRLAELLRPHGLVVLAAYDAWTARPLHRRATEMLLIARKE